VALASYGAGLLVDWREGLAQLAGFLHKGKFTGGNSNLYVGEVVFDHFLEVPFHFVGEGVEWLSSDKNYSALIILLTVVPNELDVIKNLFYCPVLACLKSFLDFEQVHWMFN